MKIAKLFRVAMTGIAVFAAANLWAQDGGQGRAGGRGNNGDAIFKQLDLSDSQMEQIRGVLEESNTARQAVMAKHGIEMGKGVRPDREKMKEAQPEIAKIRKDADAKVAAILSEEQMAKYQELRGKGRQGGGQKQKKGAK